MLGTVGLLFNSEWNKLKHLIEQNLRYTLLYDALNYIAVFSIFSDIITLRNFTYAEMRGPVFIMLFIALIWMLRTNRIYLNKYFILIFTILIGLSLFNIILGQNTFGLLFKQIFGIGVSALAYYYLIRINNNNVKKIFDIYLNIAFMASLISIFQQISFVLGFTPGYNYTWLSPLFPPPSVANNGLLLRTKSFLGEPTGFCFIMMPALFYVMADIVKNKKKTKNIVRSLAIVAAYLLTFSSTGYLGFIIASFIFLIYNLKARSLIVGVILIIFFVFAGYNFNKDLSYRMGSVTRLINGEIELERVDMSTFALFSNALVAFESFKSSPFIGSGLGSYGLDYARIIGGVVDPIKAQDKIYLSSNDANSLFLRLLAETGLLGIIIISIFMWRFFLSKNMDNSGYLWVINNGVFCVLVMRLIRGGHYFNEGLIFFFWMYYFSKINAQNFLKLEQKI